MTGRVRAILVALALAAAIAAGSAQAVGSDMLAIAPPADITVAATTPCGQSYCAQVNYSYSITGGQPPYSLICNLASGSLFLVGSHAISCFGQDSADNSTPPSTFTITVTGGGPPPPPPPPPAPLTISAPADITVAATTPCGQSYCAQVNYSYAITGGQPPYSLICNLASGSLFLVGSHAISCFGQDSADNSTPEASFVITVDPPSTGGGGGSGITADITGCTQPTCMGNSLSFFQLDGCQCDFGPFNGNRMSYSLATPAPAGAIAPPVTIHTGNQTNDVSIMFSANGVPVGVASTSASGQQSGIDYTSDPIALVPGKNLLSLTVDDPLHRLAAATYTWAFDYSPPTTTTGSATSPVPGSRSSNGSGSAASSASPSNASAPATAGLTRGSVSKPAIVLAKGGQHMLSFSVRLATAALVHVALTARSGKTLVRFSVRATKGRTLVRRHLPAPAARHGSRLTLRLTLRVHGKEQRVAVAFTA